MMLALPPNYKYNREKIRSFVVGFLARKNIKVVEIGGLEREGWATCQTKYSPFKYCS